MKLKTVVILILLTISYNRIYSQIIFTINESSIDLNKIMLVINSDTIEISITGDTLLYRKDSLNDYISSFKNLDSVYLLVSINKVGIRKKYMKYWISNTDRLIRNNYYEINVSKSTSTWREYILVVKTNGILFGCYYSFGRRKVDGYYTKKAIKIK